MLDVEHLEQMLTSGESLDVEFKSELRRQISDREIYEEVVALANAQGGALLLGVEDDGRVSGGRPRHGDATEPVKLQAAIFNNTVPSINTRISVVKHPDGLVTVVEVDSYPEICATAKGKCLHRATGSDGKPQSRPYYPRDQRSRRIDLGLMDFSAQPLDGLDFQALDPLEFERLRGTIRQQQGAAKSLLEHTDEELAKALKLVESRRGSSIPNVTGLLLVGREEVLESALPTCQVMFQVFDGRSNVKVNNRLRGPLLKTLEEILARFEARNAEHEVMAGMFRIPVPDYSPTGFREAVNNALLHRDYSRLEAVYVQWHADHLLITNPGTFPAGITPDNILVHEPKPRNPRLAEVFNRIGLIEQSGRGVDRIYEGQVRYGRPAPDYTRSDENAVRIVLRGGEPSLAFAALVHEQDRGEAPLSLDELLVLNELFYERRTDSVKAGRVIQKGTSAGRSVLEGLQERGLLEAKGERRGRVYHLAAKLYQRLGGIPAYVRTRGFTRIRQREMVLNALNASPDGRITRKAVSELCQITPPQAYHLLHKMLLDSDLQKHGGGRATFYTRKRTD